MDHLVFFYLGETSFCLHVLVFIMGTFPKGSPETAAGPKPNSGVACKAHYDLTSACHSHFKQHLLSLCSLSPKVTGHCPHPGLPHFLSTGIFLVEGSVILSLCTFPVPEFIPLRPSSEGGVCLQNSLVVSVVP